MNEKTQKLGKESIGKLLISFSIPAIIGMLVSSLYNIIDRIFIGRYVNTDALSGIAITMPITFIIMAFGMLIGNGSGALISIRLGQGRKEEAEKILGNAFISILIIAILLPVIFLPNLDWFLKLFGAGDNILPYARSFIQIILLGSFFAHISFALSAVIRAEGSPRISMMTQLINALLNIILDIIFIAVMGWGVKASAIATVISQMVSAAWVLIYLSSKKSAVRLTFKSMGFNLKIVGGICMIGISPFIMHLIASFINTLFNRSLSHFGGDVAIGAFGIINSVSMLIMMPVFGIVQGSQPIIGYNYGAKQYHRVKKTALGAIVGATVFTGIGWILLQLFPQWIIGIFTKDTELIKTGSYGLVYFNGLLFLVGAQVLCSTFFQSIGKGLKSLVLTISRQVLFLLPLLLVLPHYYKLKGVWMAMPVSDFLASILTFSLFAYELNKMMKSENQVTTLEK